MFLYECRRQCKTVMAKEVFFSINKNNNYNLYVNKYNEQFIFDCHDLRIMDLINTQQCK